MSRSPVQALTDKHEALIDRVKQHDDPPKLVPEMETFLERLQEAGRDIPLGDERDLVRSLATYWAGNIYEYSASGTYPLNSTRLEMPRRRAKSLNPGRADPCPTVTSSASRPQRFSKARAVSR